MVALATILLVSDKRGKQMFLGIIWSILLITGGGKAQGSSFDALYYHWFLLATSEVVENNRKIDIWIILWGVLIILDEG